MYDIWCVWVQDMGFGDIVGATPWGFLEVSFDCEPENVYLYKSDDLLYCYSLFDRLNYFREVQ